MSDWDPGGAGADGASGASGLPVGDLLRTGPVTTDLPTPRSALAIGAHPDDVEFGCGATLAKWAASGCEVHHLVLTDGSKGSWDPGADLPTLVELRASESRAAAAVIAGVTPDDAGADRVQLLGAVDGELVAGTDERRAVAAVIRSVRPEVLLGHDPWRRYRLHPDHRAAGTLTVDALVAARDPHFLSELQLPPHRPEVLLLFEPDLPNHVEDASGYEDTKIAALLCHRSQFASTMGIGDARTTAAGTAGSADERSAFAAKVRRQLSSHGALGGLASAEAFRRIDEL